MKIRITECVTVVHEFNESEVPPEALAALKEGEQTPVNEWFCNLSGDDILRAKCGEMVDERIAEVVE